MSPIQREEAHALRLFGRAEPDTQPWGRERLAPSGGTAALVVLAFAVVLLLARCGL